VSNLVRGTLRYPGFCQAWSAIIDLGLTEDTLPIQQSGSMRFRDLLDALTDGKEGTVKSRIAKQLNLDEDGEVIAKLIWLDLLSSKKIRIENATPAQIIEELIIDKWSMQSKDRDMVVMRHEIDYDLMGKSHCWTSTMIQKGEDEKHTAMTKLVGLPLAIATKLIMLKEIKRYGVSIPVYSDIYKPVLKELSSHGVTFIESARELI